MEKLFKKVLRAKNLILCAACLLICCLSFAPKATLAEQQLGAIDYLDYVIESPEYLWADKDVVAVSSGGKLTFFTQGKIFRTELRSDGEIARLGSSIVYFHDSLLFSTEIGTFTETPVLDSNGSQITANSFSICGDRLLVINSSGAALYKGLSRTELDYGFDEDFDPALLRAAKVYVGQKDYYSVGGEIYANGSFLRAQRADYMTELNGELYYANKEGVFKLCGEDGAPTQIYQTPAGSEHSALDLCAYGDTLLFIDGATCDLMQIVFSDSGASVRKFVFDVEITTGLKLEYNPTPVTVSVLKGTRIHAGTLDGGTFTFLGTHACEADKDEVKLGEIDGYSLLYGHGGYSLVKNDLVTVLDQNTPITFDKGVILHDCKVLTTCVANPDTVVGELKKGTEVSVLSIIEMNGARYSRVQYEGGEGFILTGEVTEKFLATSNKPTAENGSVTGKDNTLVATVIILLSTGIFIVTMFILLVKKEYVKL